MAKHRRSHHDQPVTRREVLRIVQRARDDIIRAVVVASPLPAPEIEMGEGVTRVQVWRPEPVTTYTLSMNGGSAEKVSIP